MIAKPSGVRGNPIDRSASRFEQGEPRLAQERAIAVAEPGVAPVVSPQPFVQLPAFRQQGGGWFLEVGGPVAIRDADDPSWLEDAKHLPHHPRWIGDVSFWYEKAARR